MIASGRREHQNFSNFQTLISKSNINIFLNFFFLFKITFYALQNALFRISNFAISSTGFPGKPARLFLYWLSRSHQSNPCHQLIFLGKPLRFTVRNTCTLMTNASLCEVFEIEIIATDKKTDSQSIREECKRWRKWWNENLFWM